MRSREAAARIQPVEHPPEAPEQRPATSETRTKAHVRLVPDWKQQAEEAAALEAATETAWDHALDTPATVPFRDPTQKELNRVDLRARREAIPNWQFWRGGECAQLDQALAALEREIQEEQGRLDHAESLRRDMARLELRRSDMKQTGESLAYIDRDMRELKNRIGTLERGIVKPRQRQQEPVSQPTQASSIKPRLRSADEQQLAHLQEQYQVIPTWKFWRRTEREHLAMQIEALKNKMAPEEAKKEARKSFLH